MIKIVSIPNEINGQPIDEDIFSFIVHPSENDENDWIIKSWNEVKKTTDRPEGLTSAEKSMYFKYRYFLEHNDNGWCDLVFVSSRKCFYSVHQKWEIIYNIEDVNTEVAKLVETYFGRYSVPVESACVNALKSFYSITSLNQDMDYVAFNDCVLNRPALLNGQIEVSPIDAKMMINDYIPHNVWEAFNHLQSQSLELEDVLLAIEDLPICRMYSHFMEESYLKMVFGMFADVIDTADPFEWLFFFQSRHGGTGKGTIRSFFEKLVGLQNQISMRETTLKSNFAESKLLGRRLYVLPETSKDAFKSSVLPLIKSYSGGDSSSAEFKYANGTTEFKPKGIFFISTNDTPKLPPTEHAIFRRIIMIPMPNVTPLDPETYQTYKEMVINSFDLTIALCTLLIPYKRELYDMYHSEHQIEELYENAEEESEWDYFEYAVQPSAISNNYVELEALHRHFQLYCDINQKESVTSLKGFGKMFNKYLSGAHVGYTKKRVMVYGVRATRYYGIATKAEFWKEIEDDYVALMEAREIHE